MGAGLRGDVRGYGLTDLTVRAAGRCRRCHQARRPALAAAPSAVLQISPDQYTSGGAGRYEAAVPLSTRAVISVSDCQGSSVRSQRGRAAPAGAARVNDVGRPSRNPRSPRAGRPSCCSRIDTSCSNSQQFASRFRTTDSTLRRVAWGRADSRRPAAAARTNFASADSWHTNAASTKVPTASTAKVAAQFRIQGTPRTGGGVPPDSRQLAGFSPRPRSWGRVSILPG